MQRNLPYLFIAALLLTGCPTRAKYDHPTVTITSPAANTYTNRPVTVTIAVAPAVDVPVYLLVDANPALLISGPPYSISWDTGGVSEGPHTLTARAVFDGTTVLSAPLTVVVDKTPPTILSRTPAQFSTDFRLRTSATVSFSEPILAASLNQATVQLSTLSPVSPIPTNVSLSTDGKTASIKISDPSMLTLPLTVIASLTSGITDLAGNSLMDDIAWEWTIPDWIRAPPLSTSGPGVMAIGSDSLPVVAFTPSGGSANQLGVAHLSSNSSGLAWTVLPAPSSMANTAFGGYSITVDAQGAPVVAWVEPGTNGIQVARWLGTAWDTSILLLPISTGSSSPIIRLDADQRPFVAWTASGGSSGIVDVAVAHWTGTEWDTSFGLTGQTLSSEHSLIIDASGNPMVGYMDGTLCGAAIWNGSVWTRVSTTCGGPTLGLDAASVPLILGQGIVDRLEQGAWVQAFLPVPTSLRPERPQLAMTPDHLPVVTWVDVIAMPYQIGLARWTGTSWDERAGLFHADASPVAERTALTVDPQGSPWVGWRENGAFNVWMSNY